MNYSAIKSEIRSKMRDSSRNPFGNLAEKNAQTPVSRINFNLASKYGHYGQSSIENYIKRTVEENSLSEHQARDIEQKVRRDLQSAFVDNKEGIKNDEKDWKIYGSYSNGLACKDSDLDFHNGSFDDISHGKAERHVKYVWKLLSGNSKFEPEYVLPEARIPLAVLTHKSTKKEFSISFSSETGVANSSMMKLFLTLNPNLKVLTLFLRHVLVQHELYETNKLTSYVLFWLVVFFMQQKKQLPTVETVRRSARTRHFIQNWDYSVPDSYYKYSGESLSSLYYGFLEFYKNFNFLNYVISPYLGCALRIEDFENWQIPSEALRIKHLNGDGVHSFKRSFINVQDPSLLIWNVAANISAEVANDFRSLCGYLHEKCHESLYNGRFFDIGSPSGFMSTRSSITDVNQVVSISLDFESRVDKRVELKQYFIEAVCRLMETVLEFKRIKIVHQDVSKMDRQQGDPVKTKITMIYFDYCSEYRTRRNRSVESIFKGCSLKENSSVFFMCEICGNHKIKLMVDGNARFIQFMQECGKELLECTSK